MTSCGREHFGTPPRVEKRSTARTLRAVVLLCALCAVAVGGSVAAAESPHEGLAVETGRTGVRLTVDVPAPVVSSTAEGAAVVLPGYEVPAREPGAPELPARSLLVAIPAGSSPTLRFRVLDEVALPGARPRPVPSLRFRSRERFPTVAEATAGTGEGASDLGLDIERREARVADPAAYAAPAEPIVRFGRTGTLRDQAFVEVRIAPAWWDAGANSLRVARRIEIDIGFDARPVVAPAPSGSSAFEDVLRRAFVNYGQGRGFRAASGESNAFGAATVATSALDPTQPAFKIRIRSEGLRRLTPTELSGSAILSEPISTWKMLSRGVEVPIQVQDDGDDFLEPGEWIQFWGRPLDEESETVLNTDIGGPIDLYEMRDFSDEAIYFLTVDAGSARARVGTRDAAPTLVRTPPTSFEATAHQEVEDAWRPLGAADPWYWLPTLTAGGATFERTIDVPLPGLSSTTAPLTARAHLRGVSEDEAIFPDHATRVQLRNASNQTLATQDDDGTFDGRTLYLHAFGWTWPGSGAQASDPAKIRIEARTSADAGHQVIVDWVEVVYRRSFAASGDTLVFSWPDEDAEFVVSGLSSASSSVYELTAAVDGTAVADPVRLTGATATGAGPFSLRFRIDDDPALPPGTMRRFAVVGPSAVLVPAGADAAVDTVSDLRDNANQADLLVIAHPSVLDDPANCASAALTALLDFRALQGVTSRVVCIEDVQDEFNDGHAGPLAIRNFLRYVLSDLPGEGWASPKPYAVLLLGDGSYAYKDGTAGGNFVPTQILFKDDPSIGYYASDNVLALASGNDQLADLFVGRLPARSVAEADTMLGKILDYEQTPAPGSWTGRALFVSDRGKDPLDSFEPSEFERINQIGIDAMKIPPHTSANLRYWSDYGGVNPAAIRQDIKDEINGISGPGTAMMQFTGHGNFQLWSDDVLFCGDESSPFCPIDDTQDLVNGLKLPWLLVHNCLTSGFHTTAAKSMGESWVKRAGGGAVAVYAPSGLGFRFIGEVVTDEIWNNLYGPAKERTLGVPVMNNLVRLCGQDSIEACQYYVLLGDPLTRLQLPTVGPPTALAATPGNGQVVLDWTASTTPGAVYDVYRTQALNQPYAKINGAPVADGDADGFVQYTDAAAVNTRTYYYYVVALDGQGFESRWSNFNSDCDVSGPDCVRATPLNPDPPSPPTGLTATDAESGGRIDLIWTPNPEDDVDRYYVHYGTEPGVYAVTEDAGRGSAYSLTGLDDGQPYYIVLTATNTSGNESTASDEVVATPSFVRGLKSPAFIADLRVDKSGTDAALSWTAVTEDIFGKPESVAYYEVFRGTAPDFLPSDANRITPPGGIATTSYTDAGALAPGGPDYHWLVRAVDVDGNVGGLGRSLPDGIGDLTLGKSALTPGNLILSWTAVTTVANGVEPTIVDRYDVYASSQPFTREDLRDGLVPALTSTTGTSVEITPAAGSRYYGVLVIDNRGNVSPY